MSKTTPITAAKIVDPDSLGTVTFDALRDHPPMVIPEGVPTRNLLDAALTRVSRVQIFLRALETETQDNDRSVLYGHLSGALHEVIMLLSSADCSLGGES